MVPLSSARHELDQMPVRAKLGAATALRKWWRQQIGKSAAMASTLCAQVLYGTSRFAHLFRWR